MEKDGQRAEASSHSAAAKRPRTGIATQSLLDCRLGSSPFPESDSVGTAASWEVLPKVEVGAEVVSGSAEDTALPVTAPSVYVSDAEVTSSAMLGDR